MKNLITILILFVAVGCGKSLKEEDFVGTYKSDSIKIVLKAVNVCESYSITGTTEQFQAVGTWEIDSGEIVLTSSVETKVIALHLGKHMEFYRIETNGDLTNIAIGMNKDGVVRRTDYQPKDVTTYKKVK